eukprot:scaffold6567_cov73-Isochrysis_galbana.AAC.2
MPGVSTRDVSSRPAAAGKTGRAGEAGETRAAGAGACSTRALLAGAPESPRAESLPGGRVRGSGGGGRCPDPTLSGAGMWGGKAPEALAAGGILPSSSARKVGLSPGRLAGGSGGWAPSHGTSAEAVEVPPSHPPADSPAQLQTAPPAPRSPTPPPHTSALRPARGGGGRGGGRGESSHSSPPHVYPTRGAPCAP